MATDVAPTAVDDLVRAALTVSRAQLMLCGLVEAAPESLRASAVDSLAELERTVDQLRTVALQFASPPEVPEKSGPVAVAQGVSPASPGGGSAVMTDPDPDRDEHTRMPAASFSYLVAEDRWEWSDEMFWLHGFERGEVVPTTELLLAHKHPADLASVRAVFAAAVTEGRPFVCRHRIIDTRLRERVVVSFGHPQSDGRCGVVAVHGVIADVTEPLRRETSAATTAAVRAAHATRGTIEQAKGALMVSCALTPDDAFEVLRVLSNHANVRLHEVAAVVVGLLSASGTGPNDPQVAAADLLDAVRGVLPGPSAPT